MSTRIPAICASPAEPPRSAITGTRSAQGGAYGTGLLVRENGACLRLHLPHPDCRRSRGAIGRTAAYLEAAAASAGAQDVNIIGAISDAEPLLSPRLQSAVANAWLLKGMTMDDRRRMRRELLDAGPASLARLRRPNRQRAG